MNLSRFSYKPPSLLCDAYNRCRPTIGRPGGDGFRYGKGPIGLAAATKSFYTQLLSSLQAPVKTSMKVPQMRHIVLDLLSFVGARMLLSALPPFATGWPSLRWAGKILDPTVFITVGEDLIW
jgi:hypothetical protein